MSEFSKRNNLTVKLGDSWRFYTRYVPEGSEALGTVTRDGFDTGALVKLRSGHYVQVNAGASRNLDPRALAQALQQAAQEAQNR